MNSYNHFCLADSKENLTFELVAHEQNRQFFKAALVWSCQKYPHCNFERTYFTFLISIPRRDYLHLTAQIKHHNFDHVGETWKMFTLKWQR